MRTIMIALACVALVLTCSRKVTTVASPPVQTTPPAPSVESSAPEPVSESDSYEVVGTGGEVSGGGVAASSSSVDRSDRINDKLDDLKREVESLEGAGGDRSVDDEIMPLKKQLESSGDAGDRDAKKPLSPKIASMEKRRSAGRMDGHSKLEESSPVHLLDSDKPVPAARPRSPSSAVFTGAAAATVKAASHDDNEEIVSYREFCGSSGTGITPYPWDVSERYIIKGAHADSATGWNHVVSILDNSGKTLFSAHTPASGEIVLLPKIDLGKAYGSIGQYRFSIDNNAPQPIKKGIDDLLPFSLPGKRQQPGAVSLQICFLMDATGSMSDEIEQLQDVIFSIHSRIAALPSQPSVQFSIVEYRDRKDAFLVRGYGFTSDIDRFQMTLEKVSAGGGGDTPEDIEAGFAWCLDSLAWKQEALKFIFLIADAPPHLEKKERNYLSEAKECRSRGIMVCPVGASGLDRVGEYVFRQIALVTRGQFVFLHYGEAGESDGAASAADPGKVSHHTGSNYNARRLDDIVVDIVSGELGFLTPPAKIVRSYPAPKEQDELLELRMDNLLRQVVATTMPPLGKNIVLPPFSYTDTSLGGLAEYLWEAALTRLPGCTKASIIERQRLADLLKEKAISLSGLTEEQPSADIGKMLNADYMILSRLHFLGTTRLCHMRLVDCTTGEVVRAARVRL